MNTSKDALLHILNNESFNPEKYVKELSSKCIGAEELRDQRRKIQELADVTSAQLKQNVYRNYMQFIETAKEISYLESELYSLSQLLYEQRSLLSNLGVKPNPSVVFEDESLSLPEVQKDAILSKEDTKKKLIKVLENVDGAMSLVENSDRIYVYEGPLLELDPLEGTPLKRIYAFLFNDVLMICSGLSNDAKRGAPKYKMQVVYELPNIAVVNMKDFGSKNLSFKLLAHPDTRVFQCPSVASKKDWLDKYEQMTKEVRKKVASK